MGVTQQTVKMAPRRVRKQTVGSESTEHDGENERITTTVRRSFNKTDWRKQKYSHKTKRVRFEEQRQKIAIRKYHKELLKISEPQKGQEGKESKEIRSSCEPKRKRSNPLNVAKKEFHNKVKEKEAKHLQIVKNKEEQAAAIEKYHKEKIRRNKILSKKTKKGQPVMAGRMQLLLEKIQKMVG